jgi:hypothetical protein
MVAQTQLARRLAPLIASVTRARPEVCESAARPFQSMKESTVYRTPLDGMTRESSRDGAGHAWLRVSVAMVAAFALIALVGCGSSKPAYCSTRTSLENSVKNLPSSVSSSGISSLKTQVKTIENQATTLVNQAKSDFPSETSAVKSSVDTLSSAVKALPSSPSAAQLAAIAADSASVVSSVNKFFDASKSKCS